MGIYINPRSETKEAWLAQNAKQVEPPSEEMMPDYVGGEQMLVCLVKNPAFSAALCVNNMREYVWLAHEIVEIGDTRPRTWWVVSRANAAQAVPSPYARYIIDENLR